MYRTHACTRSSDHRGLVSLMRWRGPRSPGQMAERAWGRAQAGSGRAAPAARAPRPRAARRGTPQPSQTNKRRHTRIRASTEPRRRRPAGPPAGLCLPLQHDPDRPPLIGDRKQYEEMHRRSLQVRRRRRRRYDKENHQLPPCAAAGAPRVRSGAPRPERAVCAAGRPRAAGRRRAAPRPRRAHCCGMRAAERRSPLYRCRLLAQDPNGFWADEALEYFWHKKVGRAWLHTCTRWFV